VRAWGPGPPGAPRPPPGPPVAPWWPPVAAGPWPAGLWLQGPCGAQAAKEPCPMVVAREVRRREKPRLQPLTPKIREAYEGFTQ